MRMTLHKKIVTKVTTRQRQSFASETLYSFIENVAPDMEDSVKKYYKNFKIVILSLGILILGIFVNIYLIKKESSRLIRSNPYDAVYTVKHNSDKSEVNNIEKEEVRNNTIPSSNNDWKLVIVNKNNPIPINYEVDLITIERGYLIDERIYHDLRNMLEDARAEGLEPWICSAYRTAEKQTALFNKEVEIYINNGYTIDESEEMASKWVAKQGTSEHQTGLAVDIVANSYQILDENQEMTAEQQWLLKNCHKYGFILRYPADKADLTGVGYEPWHYRYVGEEAAAEIMEKGLCLEEYE